MHFSRLYALYSVKISSFLSPLNTSRTSWWYSGWESAYQCRRHGCDAWSRKIPHAVEQLSAWATATEPQCCNYWSLCAYSLCSTREATRMRSLFTTKKSSHRSPPQLEKTHTEQQRPSTTENKQTKKLHLTTHQRNLTFVSLTHVEMVIIFNISTILQYPPIVILNYHVNLCL